MSAITIQQMAERVLRLMDDGGRGAAGVRLRRAARRLPRRVRQAAERLAVADADAADPARLLRVDEAQVAADYDLLLRHLARSRSRLRAVVDSVGRAVAVSVVLLGGLALWALMA